MRVLWAPWRLSYIESSDKPAGCIFCDKPLAAGAGARREALLLAATDEALVMLNRYPYANAHIMVAPRSHSSDFAALEASQVTACTRLLQSAVDALDKTYSPQGFNIGMNLGRSGGAGIDDHMHWHVVPRWEGDTNFMPMLADVRVMPEHLETTYDRLLPHFQALS